MCIYRFIWTNPEVDYELKLVKSQSYYDPKKCFSESLSHSVTQDFLYQHNLQVPKNVENNEIVTMIPITRENSILVKANHNTIIQNCSNNQARP